MYVVMNKFKINEGKEEAFEAAWRSRETHLGDFEGFIQFFVYALNIPFPVWPG